MPAAVEGLKRRAEFLRVAGAKRKFVAPGLIRQSRRRDDPEGPVRVGFTASRRVGNAVGRNRARRRLRAAVQAVIPSHARAGHDYVVIARSEKLRRPFADPNQDLEAPLKRLVVWHDACSGATQW